MKWFLPCLPRRIVYLSRSKLNGLGRHAGVLIEWFGGSFVVDRQSDRGLKPVSYEEFARGHVVAAEAAIEEPRAVRAAFERLTKEFEAAPGYDLFKRNCEHFARKVVFGEDRSLQIEALLVVGVAVLMLMAVSRS